MIRYRATALSYYGRSRNAATFEEAETLARRQCTHEPSAKFQINRQETRAGFRSAWHDAECLATIQSDNSGRVWTDLTPQGSTLV